MSSNLLWFSSPYLSLFLSHFVPPPLSCFGVFSGLSMSLYVPRWTPFFLFYIMAILPPDGKKKISFSVSYSFPIWVLWARFQARNVWIQRSLFLGKLYKIESSFQRHEYCNFWIFETWDMGHNPRQHLECRKFKSDSILVFWLAFWASKQQKWVLCPSYVL